MRISGVGRKNIMIELDNVEACGLLEDMNEVTYYQTNEGKPWIDRQFENVRSELMKLLDEMDIQ